MLRTVLFIAVPVMLVVAGGLAYWLAGRSLAPVDALDKATKEITARSLDRRLPVTNANDELGRLTTTINEMIARLECSFAELRRFTADASHELRTPLAVLRTEIEVAMRQSSTPEQLQGVLGSALEECDRLARLTDQLLALARHDAERALRKREAVDLAKLVAGTVELLLPLAESKGVTLKSSVGERASETVIEGESERLRQIFINLVDNAIKFTPSGGNVEVAIATTNTAVVVTIRDTGEGIPPEHLPRVFERFYRVDKARSREMGGSGLGLSIARGIVEAHGGTVLVESTVGFGSTFTVNIPRNAS
jgi:heavy metal sensor kinase